MERLSARHFSSCLAQFGRSGFLPVAFCICLLALLIQQAALGQAQIGSAEACFDQGPEKPPALTGIPIPSSFAALPAQVAQGRVPPNLAPARVRPANGSSERPVQVQQETVRTRSRWTPETKSPDGTLTARR
jgi:hypothetical protein